MKRLAILGSPINQALSPVLHGAAYRALGLDWTWHGTASTAAPRTGHINSGCARPSWGIPIAILAPVSAGEWDVYVVNEVRDWIAALDDATRSRVVQAIDALAEGGPGLGRPLVDTITGSKLQNLKELRPGTVRILFAFDPWRSSILLVAGDKAGRWNAWYQEAIPLAEQRYEIYIKERAQEEEGGR